MTAIPAPKGLEVAYVLGTTAGGTGRHVAMLAAGCAARGVAVTVYGPGDTEKRFFRDREVSAAVSDADPPRSRTFVRVEIAARPRPARDTAAVLRLRRLLLGSSPDVVHAHGLR
ncbi:MAG TPA: glycosyltransferase, partial [Streptosporangiaceae bacterium]